MDLGWVHVGKFVKAERSLMAVDTLNFFAPVPRPKGPQNEVRAVRRRKLGKSVNAAMLSDPIAGLNVIRVCGLSEPCALRLLGREKSLLGQRVFEEPLRGCAVRLRLILQLSCGSIYVGYADRSMCSGDRSGRVEQEPNKSGDRHDGRENLTLILIRRRENRGKAGGPYENFGGFRCDFRELIAWK